VIKDGVFYGRYWGCLPEYEVKNLHFEVCYWSAIEYCIEHKLDRMEPGAGGGGTPVVHCSDARQHRPIRRHLTLYIQFSVL
jgi:predicted N-acyltransferase